MNGNRQLEVHYINTGFPYTVAESFMDFFEGLTYTHAGALQDQEIADWSMHTNSYKHGLPGSSSTPYYGYNHAYESNDNVQRMDGSRRARDYHSFMSHNEPHVLALHGDGGTDTSTTDPHSSTEECNRIQHVASNSQVFWQDNIDPDNMTYEELLDLGEAVGSHNRGLSQERISSLPISKYKRGFFSRKKAQRDRCVVCQMEYKLGDRRMTLPCKHVYHTSCVTKWLSINKACPVCNVEVFGDDCKH